MNEEKKKKDKKQAGLLGQVTLPGTSPIRDDLNQQDKKDKVSESLLFL